LHTTLSRVLLCRKDGDEQDDDDGDAPAIGGVGVPAHVSAAMAERARVATRLWRRHARRYGDVLDDDDDVSNVDDRSSFCDINVDGQSRGVIVSDADEARARRLLDRAVAAGVINGIDDAPLLLFLRCLLAVRTGAVVAVHALTQFRPTHLLSIIGSTTSCVFADATAAVDAADGAFTLNYSHSSLSARTRRIERHACGGGVRGNGDSGVGVIRSHNLSMLSAARAVVTVAAAVLIWRRCRC
jgi:hypothetical protein